MSGWAYACVIRRCDDDVHPSEGIDEGPVVDDGLVHNVRAAAATAEEAQGEVEGEIDVHQVIDSDLALAVGAAATASSEGAATMDIDAEDAREAAIYGEIVTSALEGFVILQDVAAAAVDVEARLGQNVSMIIFRGAEVGGPAASYMQHRVTHKAASGNVSSHRTEVTA